MKDVTIQYREEGEVSPREEAFYLAVSVELQKLAFAVREEGELDDHAIIAMTTRTLQQLACNATRLAAQLEVTL